MTIVEKMDKSVGLPEYHLSEEYVSKKRMLSLGVGSLFWHIYPALPRG